MKQSHAYNGYANVYNIEILNSFNPKLQLKDTESTITNKPKDLLTKLKGFKFVTTLVLEFKKMEKETSKAPFIRSQRLKKLLMRVILTIYLNQPIVRLY